MEPANQQTCKQGEQYAPIYKSNNGPQEPWIVLKIVLEFSKSNTQVWLSLRETAK